MPSSLATQLAQNASLNASILSTSKRKPTESYLFPASQASTHDIESLYFLALNAFLQFKSIQPSCWKYEAALFSDAVKDVDRTLLTKEKNEELDRNLKEFLVMLGPWLMEGMIGKILEWLVRRFRINEFNIEDILSLFMPYHESPHFAKMLSILHIQPQSRFSFLLPFKAAAKHLPRVSLVSSMVQDTDLARFVSSLLPTAHEGGYSHRTLLSFNIAVMHEYMVRCKVLDEGIVTFVVSALIETLKGGSDTNVILGSYVLLSTLSQKCRLSTNATKAIIGAMIDSAPRVPTWQFMKAAVAICEAQDEVDHWGDSVFSKVLKLSNFNEEVRKSLEWQGSEKFVGPMLKGLVAQIPEESASTVLQSLLTANNVQSVIVRRVATLLIDTIVSADKKANTTPHRTMLSTIQQRHSFILQKATDQVKSEKEDPLVKETIDQVIIALSMTYPRHGACVDMVVASTNADHNVRLNAVNSLLKILSHQKNIEPAELASIHSALLARIHDNKLPVLQALYSKPSLISPILAKSSATYITAIAQILSSDPSRLALVRIHLSFLASHFSVTNPSHTPEIFEKCFFPFLLFSRARKEAATMVWEVIEGKSDGVAAYEVIQGCVDDWKWHTDGPRSEPNDVMVSVNMAIAARMAENILASTNYDRLLASLLGMMQDPDLFTRALAHLIARALLSRLSGDQQIDAAHRMLDAMHLDTLSGMEDIPDGDNNARMSMDDGRLGLQVVQRPAAHKTTYWLRTSILILLPSIPRPNGIVLDWLADPPSNVADQRGARYTSLMRAVYKLANSSTSLPLLTTNIIRILFVGLKDDSLVFLIGMVVRSLENKEERGLCIVALRHAASFLTARSRIDYQTILPSLIVLMRGNDSRIREAALDCVDIIANKRKKAKSVYAFDVVYGEGSANLQYLDTADLSKYVNAIIEYRSLIAKDRNYINIVHEQYLAQNDSTTIKHNQRILSYLLSHVCAIGLPSAKIALLQTVENISDGVKAQTLLPAIQNLVQSPILGDIFGASLEKYAALVISSFDKSSSGELNEQNSLSWPVFVSALRHIFQSGVSPAPQAILARNLEQGLFSAMNSDRQIETCIILLEVGVQDPNALYSKKVLANIVRGAPLIQQLLMRLRPTSNQAVPPAKKRAKLDEPPSSALSDDLFSSLGLLAEVLAASTLPGSLDLISRMLDTLSSVLHYESPAQGDKSYVEQLLMSAIDNAAQKVEEVPNLSPSAIRLDILVELIRVSDNTQTFQQALLLMANLARLAPDSVLRNVMPVFTFMGSNVFHRDDSYSFTVVQETINSIVPVMVSSLKSKYSGKMDIYVGSREFLRIFTDAANHIPRHRRTKFYSHLVDILGPEDFLAPVCMLLIDKVVNRVIRQSVEEVQGSLALPVSILQHYPSSMQIFILTELLRESQRLAACIADPEQIAPTFLNFPRDEEHSLPLTAASRRRAQALVIFVGHAMQSSPPSNLSTGAPVGGTIGDLVLLLVQMATLRGGPTVESNVGCLSKAAQSTISRSLGVMPATDFISAVLAMLRSGDEIVQSGALDLLSSRLEHITDQIRRNVTPIIIEILLVIRRIISSKSEEPLVTSALNALRAVGVTMCPGEESSLAEVIPSVLAIIHGRKATAAAIMTLPPLVAGLGPRIIPNFRIIIDECVSVLSESSADDAPAVTENALNVLQGLLVSIPTFWGSKELTVVIKLYTDHLSINKTHSAAMTSLLKAIAKRAPAKTLLPTLHEMWPSIEASPRTNCDGTIAYFILLKKSLRAAARPVVLENVRPLFEVFVEAFEITSKFPSDKAAETETQSISAFLELVVKLNEAAFRPLFRKLYDWAFADDTDTSNTKKVSFCHVYASLLDFFQGLMSTYMSFLLQPFTELLQAFSLSRTDNQTLWICLIDILKKSFIFDEGAFWRDDKLQQVVPLLVEQVPVCIRLGVANGKTTLPACLEALAETVNDDALLKSINLGLLMHTRSEDVRLRIFALTCSEILWRAHGGKLLGYVAETTAFIAECAEDENDLVVKESHKLKDAVENIAGNINGL